MTTENPPVPVNVGDVLLGKYVVERIIGAGGMGVVVAVRHRDLGELHAMKFMLPAALANEQAVERFVREARSAAKLKSPHVAKVHDVGRLPNGSPYMVMDYLDGNDLEAEIETKPLSVVEAASYIMQACDAIAEAHDAGIVHRDLKPANLFLEKRSSGARSIKVLDFGISKSLNPDEAAGSMTQTTAIMGSPYYMSPEQMRSSKNVDHRTDIWALGVILYQLTTQRVPFPGDTITEVCSGVLADDPPSLQSLFGIPHEFDNIVRRCLQKQPGHRFGNARELAAALAPIAGVSPGTSGLNLQIGSRASNPMGTMAMVAGAGHQMSQSGSTIVAGPSPMLGNVTGPGQTQGQWGKTQPTERKKSPVAAVVIGLLALGALAAGGFYLMNQGKASTTTATTKPDATEEQTSKAIVKATATAAAAPATATATAKPVESVASATTASAFESATTTAVAEVPKPRPVYKPAPTAPKPTATVNRPRPSIF